MKKVHGWRRVLRWFEVLLLGTAALAGLAFVTVLIVLQTGWGREVVRSELEKRIGESFSGGITIGSVEGNPLSTLVLKDIVVKGPDQQPMVRVGRLAIEVELLPLLSRRLLVDNAILDDVDFVVAPARGENRLGDLITPGAAWTIAVRHIEVRRGHVTYGAIDLENLDVKGSLMIPAVGPLDTAFAATGQWRQRRVPIALSAIIHDDEQRTSVPAAIGKVGDLGFMILGASRLKSAFALPVAGTFAVVDPSSGSSVAIRATFDGRFTDMTLRGAFDGARVSGVARADLQRLQATGLASLTGVELAEATRGTLEGRGNAVVAFDVEGERARLAGWAVANELQAVIDMRGYRRGTSIVMERGVVAASATGLDRSCTSTCTCMSTCTASVQASGTLSPSIDLDVAAHAEGGQLRVGKLAVNRWHLAATGTHLGDRTRGTVKVSHLIEATTGEIWQGENATLSIDPRRIDVRNLRTASRTGHIAVDGSYQRLRRQLAVTVDASIDLATVTSAYPGRVDAHLEVKPRGRTHRLRANVRAASEKTGAARVTVDVDVPRDVANAAAWRKLRRDAIHAASISLEQIDLAEVARLAELAPMSGRVDGSISLAPTARGTITVRHAGTPKTADQGTLDANIAVEEPALGELGVALVAHIDPAKGSAAKELTAGGRSVFTAEARFNTPERLFDPGAWRRLGPAAFLGGKVTADRLSLRPATLARLGITTPLHGRITAGLDITAGMGEVRFTANAARLRGGPLVRPISVRIAGVLDHESHANASIAAGDVTFLRITAKSPITIDDLQADLARLRTVPLRATATIERVAANTVYGIFNTGEMPGGSIEGTVEIAGTVARPTVDAKLVARQLMAPPEGTRPVPILDRLTLAATWDGARAEVEIDGDEYGAGTLRIRAAGSPHALHAVTASLEARGLDIAPLAVFLPGPARGLAGRIDAKVSAKGLDPTTSSLAGTIRVHDGRIPIAAEVGTLFHTNAQLAIKNRVVDLTLTGKLGRGDVKIAANVPLRGAIPTSGKLDVSIDKVQLLGTSQPILTGKITAELARKNSHWHAKLRTDEMRVEVPAQQGTELAPVGAPDDLVFDRRRKTRLGVEPERQRAPTEPWLVAEVVLRNVFVDAEEVRGILGGSMTVSVDERDEVGVEGSVVLTRAVVDLFGRRYDVDRAQLSFDGSTDPRLDIRITHDFPEVTIVAEVRGRMSKPDLSLSSEPGRYTQAELLGFLLGGEPNGNPRQGSATDLVAGAGATILSNAIGGYVKRALPVDIDVLRYEAETATSSAAILVGKWVTDTLFLAYRQRLESRPDENAGEAEVEYWIRRRLSAQAIAGNRGAYGLDLLWRKRW